MCKTIIIIDIEQSFHDLYSAMLEGTDCRFSDYSNRMTEKE